MSEFLMSLCFRNITTQVLSFRQHITWCCMVHDKLRQNSINRRGVSVRKRLCST